jgi:hypothetical protein
LATGEDLDQHGFFAQRCARARWWSSPAGCRPKGAEWVSATLEQTSAACDAPYEALEAYSAGEHSEPSP